MTVKKTGGGYAIYSKKTGRKLSRTYTSKNSPALKKRMREIEYFKHEKKGK